MSEWEFAVICEAHEAPDTDSNLPPPTPEEHDALVARFADI